MGFSLVCGILSTMIMFNYGLELAVAGQRSFLYYTSGNRDFDDNSFTAAKAPLAVDARYNEEHALVGSIFAFTLLEMIAALWSAALCFVNDQKPMDKNDDVSWELMDKDFDTYLVYQVKWWSIRTTNNKIYLPLTQQLRCISHYFYLQNSKAIKGEREINKH